MGSQLNLKVSAGLIGKIYQYPSTQWKKINMRKYNLLFSFLLKDSKWWFKACNEEGKIRNGTHECVKCISQQGCFQCSFHKKTSDCSGDNYSHSCIRVEFNRNSVVLQFLGKQVDEN
jgi:hypothetical protein